MTTFDKKLSNQISRSQFCKQNKTHKIYREVDLMDKQAFAYNWDAYKMAEIEIKIAINQRLFDNRCISEDMYGQAKLLILKQKIDNTD